jgi:hypothetical protein
MSSKKKKKAKNPTNFKDPNRITLHTESVCDIGGDLECKVGGAGAAERGGESRGESGVSEVAATGGIGRAMDRGGVDA